MSKEPEKWIVLTGVEINWVLSPRKLFKSGFFLKSFFFGFEGLKLNVSPICYKKPNFSGIANNFKPLNLQFCQSI